MKNQLLLSLLYLTILSCEKEKNYPSSTPFTAVPGCVLISNEGNFQSGNSTITYYNPATGEVNINAFASVNQQPLGDICQSLNLINGKLYIVVNNSGKIEVCDPLTMKLKHSITGLTSPRYILSAGNNKAYVTDTYSNFLTVINLTDNSVSGTIQLSGWTEQMLLINNRIFVTNVLSDFLYMIDPSTDTVSDSILISKGAASIVEDKNGKIWILCGGDYLQTYIAALYRIDPVTKQIEISLSFNSNDYPSRLCINATSDTLYFLNNGILRMSISDSSLPATHFVASSGNNFYGLGIDKTRNEIYVSDAINFVQRGKIIRYQANGTEINNFLAGIIPGDFLILP